MSLHGVVVPAPKYGSGTPETSARPSCSKILMTMTEMFHICKWPLHLSELITSPEWIHNSQLVLSW